MKKILTILFSATLLITIIGCGPKKITVEDATTRVDALKAKGVPDLELSKVKVYLFKMKNNKAAGNTGKFRKYRDSIQVALDELEGRMGSAIEDSKAAIDSLKTLANTKKANLKGLHIKCADSLLAIADQLIKDTKPLAAKDKLEKISLMLDTLNEMQQIADSLRPKFIGTWVSEQEAKGKGLNAINRNEVRFKKDGTLYTMQKMKGKSKDYLKEDWEFQSVGTWKLKGSTAYQYITKEKCVRNIFSEKDKNGKWKRTVKPTYDSTYTDGSKDSYVSYEYLKKEYKYFR